MRFLSHVATISIHVQTKTTVNHGEKVDCTKLGEENVWISDFFFLQTSLLLVLSTNISQNNRFIMFF